MVKRWTKNQRRHTLKYGGSTQEASFKMKWKVILKKFLQELN